MTTRHALVAIILSSALAISCSKGEVRTPPPTVDAIQRVLGGGWQCFAVPSGFNEVGRIYELTPDGVALERGNVGTEGSEERDLAVGDINTENRFTLGAVASLMENAVPGLTARVSGTVDQSARVGVKIMGPKRRVGLMEIEPRAIAWANQYRSSFRPGSRLFFIQESLTASGVEYTLDRRSVSALGGEATLARVGTIRSVDPAAQPASQTPAYRLVSQAFPSRLGLCTKPMQLVAAPGATGTTEIVVRSLEADLSRVTVR